MPCMVRLRGRRWVSVCPGPLCAMFPQGGGPQRVNPQVDTPMHPRSCPRSHVETAGPRWMALSSVAPVLSTTWGQAHCGGWGVGVL